LANIEFGVVGLNPNFIAFDVEVDGAAVDAVFVVPAYGDDLVVVVFGVEDSLGFDVAVGGFVGGILGE